MKIETKPSVYGFLCGVYFLLLVAVAVATGRTREVRGRDAGVAFESVVRISVTCITAGGGFAASMGSGVIVDAHTVLTANHIAEDEPGEICVRRAVPVNGRSYLLAPGKTLPDRDLASLVSAEPFSPTFPVVYGPAPGYGEHVCSMTAYPRVLWRCGEVQTVADPPGDLSHTIMTEGGNSGSGVYDSRGRLVGIITHRWSCSNGQYCGGKMATLEGHLAGLL